MNEPLVLASAIPGVTAETGRPMWRRRAVWLFALGWTLIAGLALWWLLRANPDSSVFILHGTPSPQVAAGEKFHAWYKTDLGLQRLYPWVLLGPYVALLAFCFPLERGRLWLSLPLSVAACVAFVAASHGIDTRTCLTAANVTMIQWGRSFGSISGSNDSIEVQNEVFRTDAGTFWSNQMTQSPLAPPHTNGEQSIVIVRRRQDGTDSGLTNLLAGLPPGFQPPRPPPELSQIGLWPMLLDLLAYGAIVGLAHSVHFYRRFREREHRALFLESNLANARLDTLRAQLQPHFLFNSLNAIAALLRRDPRLAEATLMSLSELLRLSLSQSARQEVALGDELQFVQRYLEIQQTRFSDKLRVEQDIEPAAMDCLVPALLLQPLVENAIRHGIEPDENAGVVRLTAHRQNGVLVLTVEDDGVGFPDAVREKLLAGMTEIPAKSVAHSSAAGAAVATSGAASGGTGIGLANLRARLETLYGSSQQLDLVPRPEGGSIVRIQIPFRPAKPLDAARAGDPS